MQPAGPPHNLIGQLLASALRHLDRSNCVKEHDLEMEHSTSIRRFERAGAVAVTKLAGQLLSSGSGVWARAGV